MTTCKIKWLDKGQLPSGSQYWESRDGMLRLVKSDSCHGVALPTEWKLYAWKRGNWHPIAERRSRGGIEKLARAYMERLESDD